jgi:hypothetical protein
MKTINATIVLATSHDLTEEQIMERFEKWLAGIPKDVNRIMFQGDLVIAELKVEDQGSV